MISHAVQQPDHLKGADLGFQQKLFIARALIPLSTKIQESDWSAIENLNNLRNNLARDLDSNTNDKNFRDFLKFRKTNIDLATDINIGDSLKKELVFLIELLIPFVDGQKIKNLMSSQENVIAQNRNISSFEPKEADQFFISDKHRLAFCLLKYHEERDLEKEIELTQLHYVNKDKAKKWRDKMMGYFHPDKNISNESSLNNDEISKKINLIYKRLTKQA
ncbi:MAG: hypothetical protein ACP5D6_11110 [Kosmotogaceae bacterium]